MDTFRLAAKGSIMAKPPNAYPPEFRQKIMELIRSGGERRRSAVQRQSTDDLELDQAG